MKDVFPERFSELLKESELNYEEIAEKLGVRSKGTISKYATGKIKNVGLSTISRIAELFDVSPAWLIGLTDNKHYIFKD